MSDQPAIHAAAMLYSSQSADEKALPRFVEAMKAKGYAVGGILQEVIRDDNGVRLGVDAIALDNGERFPIVRPSKEDIEAGACGLNRSVLTESSAILRRAIAKPVDLLVVEKFGESEQQGIGLADDILAAMADGIPTLVAVPEAAKPIWEEFTGGLSTLLPAKLSALENWWDTLR
ncbi:MAG: DUF2478 domain-containing protein [Sneathiellales bacterium]|nr:DUF2478 domain-containing protein [Sneathiellales bacterium]